MHLFCINLNNITEESWVNHILVLGVCLQLPEHNKIKIWNLYLKDLWSRWHPASMYSTGNLSYQLFYILGTSGIKMDSKSRSSLINVKRYELIGIQYTDVKLEDEKFLAAFTIFFSAAYIPAFASLGKCVFSNFFFFWCYQYLLIIQWQKILICVPGNKK